MSPESVRYGKVTGFDGLGNWEITLTSIEGEALRGVDGQLETISVSDAQLRRDNAPTLFHDGAAIWDVSFDSAQRSQQKFMKDWHSTTEYQQLMRSRPRLGASPAERVQWERRAIDAVDGWLQGAIAYPPLATDLPIIQNELKDIELSLARAPSSESKKELHDALQARMKQLEQFHRYDLVNKQFPVPTIGDYYRIGLGECRQQAFAMQLLLQELGVDSRISGGVVTERDYTVRGAHLWLECRLSDGSQILADPTWSDERYEKPEELRAAFARHTKRHSLPSRTSDRQGMMGKSLVQREETQTSA